MRALARAAAWPNAATLALLSFTLIGCGRGDADALRFRFWGDTAEVRILEESVKGFLAENPGLKVKSEFKPAGNDYSNLLVTEFAANSAPDVIFTGDLNCDQLIQAGRFLPLEPFLKDDPEVKKADYYPLMIERFSRDGSLYLLPRDIAPVACVYYNKTLFDASKLPYPKDSWNWDQFKAAAVKLTKRSADGTATQFGYADENSNPEPYVYTSGGRMLDDLAAPTRFELDSPKSLRGLRFRLELYHGLKVMPTTNDTAAINVGSGAQALFLTGKLAMFFSGIWKTPSFREIKDFDWDIAPFPAGPEGSRKILIAGSGYGIASTCKDPAAAWKLVRYLAGRKGQLKLASTGLAQPAIMSLAASEAFLDGQKPKNKKMLLRAAQDGYTSPRVAWWGEFFDGLWRPKTDGLWVSGFKGDADLIVRQAVAEANRRFLGAK